MWETLPQQLTARKDGLLYKLIAAIPETNKRLKEKRLDLHLELTAAHAADKPSPWTRRQLTEIIAVQLAGGLDLPSPKRSEVQEAHLAEDEEYEAYYTTRGPPAPA